MLSWQWAYAICANQTSVQLSCYASRWCWEDRIYKQYFKTNLLLHGLALFWNQQHCLIWGKVFIAHFFYFYSMVTTPQTILSVIVELSSKNYQFFKGIHDPSIPLVFVIWFDVVICYYWERIWSIPLYYERKRKLSRCISIYNICVRRLLGYGNIPWCQNSDTSIANTTQCNALECIAMQWWNAIHCIALKLEANEGGLNYFLLMKLLSNQPFSINSKTTLKIHKLWSYFVNK